MVAHAQSASRATGRFARQVSFADAEFHRFSTGLPRVAKFSGITRRGAQPLPGTLLGSGVRGIIYLREMLVVEMRINLRGGDIRVPEQFLDRA